MVELSHSLAALFMQEDQHRLQYLGVTKHREEEGEPTIVVECSSSSSSSAPLTPDHEEEEDTLTTVSLSDNCSSFEDFNNNNVATRQHQKHHDHDHPKPDRVRLGWGWFSRCLETLPAHSSTVSSMITIKRALITASDSTDMRPWLHPDLRPSARFGEGQGSVKAMVRVGNNRLVTAHQDTKLRVWRVSHHESGVSVKSLATLPTKMDYVARAVDSTNYITTRRHCSKLWIEHVDAVTCLATAATTAASRSWKLTKKRSCSREVVVYSGSWDRSFKVWRMSDFKCMESVPRAHEDAINAIVVGHGGALYTASGDGTVKAWCKPRGSASHKLLATMSAHSASVNALAVSFDGTAVYSGGSDGAILAWGSETCGDERMKWQAVGDMVGDPHVGPVLCLRVIRDILCSGGYDRTIRVWAREERGDAFRLCNVAVLTGHMGPVKCLAGSDHDDDVAGGALIYSGSVDHTVKVWWVSFRG